MTVNVIREARSYVTEFHKVDFGEIVLLNGKPVVRLRPTVVRDERWPKADKETSAHKINALDLETAYLRWVDWQAEVTLTDTTIELKQ